MFLTLYNPDNGPNSTLHFRTQSGCFSALNWKAILSVTNTAIFWKNTKTVLKLSNYSTNLTTRSTKLRKAGKLTNRSLDSEMKGTFSLFDTVYVKWFALICFFKISFQTENESFCQSFLHAPMGSRRPLETKLRGRLDPVDILYLWHRNCISACHRVQEQE